MPGTLRKEDMKIVPLISSVCDWNTFAKFANEIQPGATQLILKKSEYGKVAETIAKLKGSKQDWTLFTLTVGLECERKLINNLYDAQLFKINIFETEDSLFATVTGSFQDWKDGCIAHSGHSNKQLKFFFNYIFSMLEHAAPDCVMELHRVGDGETFTLKMRH